MISNEMKVQDSDGKKCQLIQNKQTKGFSPTLPKSGT